MENIARLYWAGAVAAALYFASGIVVSTIAGFEPILILTCLLSAVGVGAALRGARHMDLAWWAGGVLLVGVMTPTTWGLIPMIVAAIIVLSLCALVYARRKS